ncbi:MAG: riboflavin biosynthesis protein RibF [Elusimicrobia bacterium RIFCSPHIGHO2_01_FULL_64_10]|nr:MAG: riboflavin biosynthesis protein RibF [Elusimicrobia bacterium RIFCSPHIGHO2_01_FULL_64_10]
MKGSVVTIGTFDGVHRGHREILRACAAHARRLELPSVAVTFQIPPRLFFIPTAAPSLLTGVEEKRELILDCGIDRVCVLHFGRGLARLSAGEFFERVLVKRFRARRIVVGYNFGFGRNREGDVRFLEAAGRRRGVGVTVIGPLCAGRVPVSSGRIRDCLRSGGLEEANRLLGRPYSITGRVVRGSGLGRRLGFPTANLSVPAERILVPGVFAVRAAVGTGAKRGLPGVCNVGWQPTVPGRDRDRPPRAEVHLLGFRGGLYGRTLRVDFIRKLRDEKTFADMDSLKEQMARDAKRARLYIRSKN